MTATTGTFTGAFTSLGIDDNADATAITIDSSENVGIGETSPLGKLHIRSSDASITSVNANSDELVLENNGTCGISIASATDSTGNISFIDSGDTNQGRIQYDHSSNNMIIRVNDAEAMRIDSSGNVGIGTTSMTTALEIHGSDDNACTIKLRDLSDYSSGTGPTIAFQGKDSSESIKNFSQI